MKNAAGADASAEVAVTETAGSGLDWRSLPHPAQVYVAAIIAAGLCAYVVHIPGAYPQPVLFALLLLGACLTSTWKVNLPIALASGSTLSVSYAANLIALILLGTPHAMLVAVAGAWTQCTYKAKRRYPLYRTVFSISAEALTIAATGLAYSWLGGSTPPDDMSSFARPIVGAIGAYFLVNTILVAGAIALTTRQHVVSVWREEFLWSGVTFIVAGGAGAMAAVVINRGEQWKAILMLAPIYLTYRTYEAFVGRLNDQKRHVAEMGRLHQRTIEALTQTRHAESALAEEKQRLASMVVEMTRLEEARQQLLEREQAARTGAEEANRLKDQFLAVVSHELRTPLSAMLGWADMLRRGKIADERRDRAYEAIFNSARRQAQLIDDLLDVGRIMSDKLRLERVPLSMNDVLRAALQVVQPLADSKGVRLTVQAGSPLVSVDGDAARLQQVAWNLLSNAIKFTPAGGVVQVQLRQVDERAEMIVTDSGQGIAADFLPAVFDAFRQGDGSSTRAQGGLGLGLAIVKHLVDAHGGTVTAHSAGEGRGATFAVRIPLCTAGMPIETGTPSSDPRARSAADHHAALQGLRVLIVEDDEETRHVVAAQLASHQAMTSTAGSAAEAFELLQREHFDVLLADIAMPVEDGYGLIRRVRSARNPDAASIPAAALTAFAREEDRQQALAAGFQAHLAKPVEVGALVAAVARLGGQAAHRRFRPHA
jgi:signal transduction histidine kinase/ActR/RegA family two-component response regulator